MCPWLMPMTEKRRRGSFEASAVLTWTCVGASCACVFSSGREEKTAPAATVREPLMNLRRSARVNVISLPPLRLHLLRRGRAPVDDVIGGGCRPHVLERVQLVRGVEDDGAGPRLDPLAFDERLDRALLDDDQLLVRVLVRRVRREPGVESRHVQLQLVERSGRRPEELTRGSDLGLFRGHGVPFEERRTHEGGLCLRRDGAECDGGGEECDEEVTTCRHAVSPLFMPANIPAENFY